MKLKVNKNFRSRIIFILLILTISLFISPPSGFATDNTQAQLKKISETTVSKGAQPFVDSKRKAEMINQMKVAYLDIVSVYPEVRSWRTSSFVIQKFYRESSGAMTGGDCTKMEDSLNSCEIELGVDVFGSGSSVGGSIRNVMFHELIHCWSEFDNDNVMSESLEETSVWPIAWNFSHLGDEDYDGREFFNKLTDIFIKRGDKGDRWRILLAVRNAGRDALNKRLDYLDIPSGYSSRFAYLDSIIGTGDQGRSTFDKALKWLNSKKPPAADYKTFSVSTSSGKSGLPSANDSSVDIIQSSSNEPKSPNCPKSVPEAGPSEGQDYQSMIANQLLKSTN